MREQTPGEAVGIKPPQDGIWTALSALTERSRQALREDEDVGNVVPWRLACVAVANSTNPSPPYARDDDKGDVTQRCSASLRFLPGVTRW